VARDKWPLTIQTGSLSQVTTHVNHAKSMTHHLMRVVSWTTVKLYRCRNLYLCRRRTLRSVVDDAGDTAWSLACCSRGVIASSRSARFDDRCLMCLHAPVWSTENSSSFYTSRQVQHFRNSQNLPVWRFAYRKRSYFKAQTFNSICQAFASPQRLV